MADITTGEILSVLLGSYAELELDGELVPAAYARRQTEAQTLGQELDALTRGLSFAPTSPLDESLFERYETAALNRESDAQLVGVAFGAAVALARQRGEELDRAALRRCATEAVEAINLAEELGNLSTGGLR
jgi:hypothetical protein